jgi:hypothetical protein
MVIETDKDRKKGCAGKGMDSKKSAFAGIHIKTTDCHPPGVH